MGIFDGGGLGGFSFGNVMGAMPWSSQSSFSPERMQFDQKQYQLSGLGGGYLREAWKQGMGGLGSAQQSYADVLAGKQPSVAAAQLQQGLAQSQRNAMALAGSARGADPTAALRTAQQTSGDMAMQANQQQAVLRAQEMDAARGGLASTSQAQLGFGSGLEGMRIGGQAAYDKARVGEVQAANEQSGKVAAQNTQNSSLFGLGSLSDERLKTDITPASVGSDAAPKVGDVGDMPTPEHASERNKGTLGNLIGLIGGAAALMSDEQNKTGLAAASGVAPQGAAATPAAQAMPDWLSKGMGLASSIGSLSGGEDEKTGPKKLSVGKLVGAANLVNSVSAMSDERQKDGTRHEPSGGGELAELLRAIRPVSFDYKDPEKDGAGRHVGLLAQDLERSEAGRTMVKETSRGKMVDGGQAALAGLAAAADLNRRVARLEGRKAA